MFHVTRSILQCKQFVFLLYKVQMERHNLAKTDPKQIIIIKKNITGDIHRYNSSGATTLVFAFAFVLKNYYYYIQIVS